MTKRDSFSCFNFAAIRAKTIFTFRTWTDLVSDLQFNTDFLSPSQLSRARRVFSIGLLPATGMLLRGILKISEKVKQEFLEFDYKPSDSMLVKLNDPLTLKIGMHVRHLPFTMTDEKNDASRIDRRATKCLNKGVSEVTASK
jgi:hypothetical protein